MRHFRRVAVIVLLAAVIPGVAVADMLLLHAGKHIVAASGGCSTLSLNLCLSTGTVGIL